LTFEEDAVRKTTPPTRRAHHFAPRTQAIALEPRILFDAALPAAAAEAYRPPENTQPADDAPVPAHPGNDRSPSHPTEKTAAPQQLPEPTKEIAFVDQAISNWQSLVAEVPPGLEIVYLDPASAPLARIASELEQRGGDFSAVHLVSHGAAGRLNLAGWRVDGAHLGTAVGELARIGAQLTSNADLLLYGCEVAADENGRQFMAALAAATGADVAASLDDTGAAGRRGNWVLEAGVGVIETRSLSWSAFGDLLTTAPTITDSVTTTRATPEDTALTLNGISVADADNPISMQATLAVTGGTLTVATGSGATVSGDHSSSVTIAGTALQINAALNGMSFAPTANQNSGIAGYSPQIDFSIDDLVNHDGPTTLSVTNFGVSAVNDPPAIGGGTVPTVPEGGSVTMDAASTVGNGFTQTQLGLSDVDTRAEQTIVKIAALPGHGVLKIGGVELAVGATFSVAQIHALTYTHDGSQVLAPSSDSFGITVDDGAGGLIVNQPVSVMITPVNQAPVVGGRITVIEGESGVRLDNNGLLPTIGTARGAITVSDPEGEVISTYQITSLPSHGTLSYDGIPIISASVGVPFFVSDISKLTYSHDGSESVADGFDIKVVDGGGGTATPASASGTVDLVIHPNDDDPVLATDVTQILGSAALTITPAMLRVTDTDSADTALTYTLTSVPDPSLGYFTLNGLTLTPGTSFTQANIDNGDLVYFSRSTTARTDSINFTVKDGGQRIYPTLRDGGIYDPGTDTLTVNSFNITIPVSAPPETGDGPSPPANLQVNQVPVVDGSNSASLLESGNETLTPVMLHATDPDNIPAELVYRLASLPTSGSLKLNGTSLSVGQSFTQQDVIDGRVGFTHAGGEDFVDEFSYSVSDGDKTSNPPQSFHFTITPQNDTPQATTSGQLVVEGGSFSVTDTHIHLADADNSVSDLLPETGHAIDNLLSFRITGDVAHGSLTLDSVLVTPGSTVVSAAQLAAGKLQYTHDGSESFTDSFKLVPIDDQGIAIATATNQLSTGAEVTMPITISPVNDAPTYFSKSQPISGEAGAIQEGATVTIAGATSYVTIGGVTGSGVPTPATGAHLVFGDNDNSSIQRQYRVMAAPVHGQLLRGGALLGVGSAFTQADLDSGAITYKHGGTETSTDSFSYLVSDGDWRVSDTDVYPQQPPPAAVPSIYLIEITPRNDVPTLSAPASLDAFATGASTTAITGVTLADVDLADGISAGEADFVRVEVQVLDNADSPVAAAQLNYAAADPVGANAFFSGKASNSLIVQGSKAQVDAVLASLTVAFGGDADASNYKIRITADDRSRDNTGTLTIGANGGPAPLNADGSAMDGTNNRVSKDIALRASNFNDPPTIGNASAYAVNEDAQLTLAGFALSDADSFDQDVTVTVELYSDAGHTTLANAGTQGRLILGATSGLTAATGDGSNTITLTGSLAEVQVALNDLKFAGAANYNDPGVGNGNLYLRTTIADFTHADGQKTAVVDNTITLVPVNDQPTLSVPTDQTLSSGVSLSINSGFAVGDAVDIAQGATDDVEVTVASTLIGAAYGTISFVPQGSATLTGNGTATVVVRGSTADVQATLNQMTYTPADPNLDATVLVSVTVNDLDNGAEGVGVTGNNTRSGSFNIHSSNVNEAPVLTVPPTLTVNEDSSNNAVAGISFIDSDDFGLVEKITLDLGGSPKGTISLASIAGLSFSTGDGTTDTKMVFTGTKAAINAALSTLRFTPTANINTVGGGNEQVLTVTVDDQGNTGTGGAKSDSETVLITISPVNDAPRRTAATTTLTAVLEDTANPPGNTVSSLFTPVFSDTTDTQTGGSTANGLAGVAIVTNAATPAQGKWQYDSGGGWTDLPTLSLTSSFLLKTTDALRFLPTANWNGTPGQLSVRLIDDSAGGVTSGSRPNLTGGATGGTTVYANLANAVGLSTAVTAVNDAPVASGTATLAAVDEDTGNPPGTAVSALITGANYSDATDTVAAGSSATALGGMAIVGNAVNPATQGAWEYSTDGGGSWTVVPAGLADGSALILPTTAQLRFVPVAEYHGTPGSLSVRLADSPQVLNASADITAQLGGTNTWSAATIPITTVVRPVNDVPTISDAGSTRDYLENAAAVTLEPLLSLADIDDTQLDRAVISISAGFVAGDRLNFSDQLGISGTFTPGTGILTLTGTASRDDYRTALRSIGFDSSSDNPGAGTRTISWSVRDVNSEAAANGQQTSLVATTTVNVTPVNDAPGFSGLDATSLNPYTENGAAIQIDNNVQLTDPELDGANWDRATLTLQRLGGANAEDLFSGTGALTLAGGGQVILSGTTVGTFTQAAGTLAITFNVAATPATADAVIRALGYSNTSEDPPASVTLAYTVNDRNSNITGGGTDGGGRDQGNGGQLAGSGSIVVNINPVNDLPVNTLPLAQSTLEDTPLVITGLAVADVDNASLSTTLSLPAGSGTLTVTGGSGATVTGDGSGTVTIAGTTAQINAALASVTYTPTADFNTGAGSLDLTIATTDGVLTDTDTLAIAVTPVADIVADTVITDEDTPISFNAITGSHGASADNFENAGRVVSAVTQGAHGSVAFAADSTLTYTPDADYHGPDSFTYTVTSGGVEETTTVDVTVNPVNDLPVNTLPLAQSTLEDTPLVITGLAVADVDNASLSTTLSLPAGSGTLTVTGGSGATVTGDGSGTVTIAGTTAQINAALASLTYTPTADFNTGAGSLDLTIATTDGVLTDTDTLAIAVTPVADIVADTVITDEDTPISFNAITGSHGASADNFENAGRVVSAVTQGAHGSVAFAADGTLTYTPDADYHGSDSFTYTVTSGGVEETTTVDVTVNPVNDLPVNTLPLAQSTLEDTPLVITGLAVADVDNASLSTTLSLPAGSGTLTVTGGSGATVTGDGSGTVTIAGTTAQINAALASLTYTPTADFNTGAGSLDLTIATTDGVLTDTDTLAIAVTPVADIVADTVITDEDTPISFNAITGSHGASADNFENAGRVVSAVTQGAHGSVAFAADGTLTYTPDADYHGPDSFTYTVTSGGVEETTTVDVTVNPVNDLPVNTLPLAQSTLEDTPLVITGLAVADVDNASLSTTLSLPAGSGTLTVTGGSGATVTGDGSGTVTIAGTTAQINAALASLTYTPTADFNTGAGSLDLTIATTDGVLTDTDTLAIAVTPVADIVADTVITDEDTPISFNAITGSHGASADNFENAGRVVSAVTQGAHGSVAFAADGTLTYTPDADYHGPDSFTYTVTSGGVEETTTVDVTVNPVNDLPVNTLPLAQSTLEDTPLVITGLAVADVDNASLSTTLSLPAGSGTLTVTGGSGATVTGDGSGTVTIAGTTAQINAALASLTYTPTADFNTGAGSLDLTIATTDGVLTDTDTLAIAVTPVADIVADTVITDEDTPISFNAITGSHGASADNFENAGRVVSAVTQGAHGSVAFAADGTLTYTPDADYHGPDSFTYTVTSGGVEETTTVDVTVNPIDDLPVAVDDTFLTDEDSALTQTLAPNDTPSGDGGNTWALATGPSHGSVVVNADGSFTYTPDADYHGPDSFTYTLTDADGDVSTATALLTVNPIDDLPVAVDDTFLTDEDSALTGQTLAPNDTPSGDGGNTWALATGPSHGTVVVNADGSFTYTPDADYHGPDSFTYTLTDADGDVSTATALLTVNPIDDLPVAVDDTFLTNEDSALTQTLAPNDTPSGDGGNTWALATGPSHGSVVVNADGSFTYTPDADYHGPDSFTYTLTDADGDVSTATALLTVNPIDDLPVAVDDTFLTDEDSALTQTLAPNDTPSGDGGNTWALATGPSHGTVVVNADGSFTYTPDADYHGPDSFTYTLTDADGDVSTATALLTVNPIDDLPVAVDDTFLTDEDSALTGQTLAPNDTPSGDGGNTWALATGPSHGSVVVNADGSFTYTPDADYHGPDSFTYTLTDADGDVSTATALLTVNPIDDLPVAVDDTFLTDEDSALTQTLAPNDTPSGDGGNTWALATGPSHGSVVVNADGSFTYTPDADYHGPDSFTYTLTDADGDVSTATALLTVNPIDDLPVAVDDTFLTNEDSALTGQTLAPNDTPSGDGGNTWALATGPSHGSVVVNADGSFTYTPDADYHGPDSFTYTLTDADGDVSTATALLTVNPIDDLPVAVDDTFLTDEDSALTGQTLAPNDTPSGDGGNTWALATGPSHGSVVVNADGSFTYTPDADYHGPDSFTYTLTDADGDVSTATALLTVNPIDDLPVAVDDTFLTNEDSALTGQTLAPNDTPSGDGGNTWALATGPSHGTVVVNADGSFTYTPDADYHGPDSFTYTLTDADGDVSTATALLTVNPIDDLPVAVDDTFLTDEDSALTGQTLAPNDTPSGDGGNTWALATGPSHGSVVVNADGSFTYTPDADYHGPDSFTYTLTDADGDVSTATALLTVNPIDDLPVAVDDTFLTDEDSALTQTLAPNDTPSGDGGNTWALATGPSHGSVVVNADGSFTYTPDADYHGTDSFTYTLTDADGDVSTATALLTVNPIDDLPVAVDDTFLTDEDSALTQTLAPNDTPSGDGGNTWALATGPSHGSVVVNADGSFTYTPDADYHGPDSFTYTLTDADGDVSTATALLTVNPIDDLPVAVDDTFLTNEDSALTGQTLAPNDTPSGDGGNTWALATGPSHGTVVVNADGSFTYTPDADYHGPDSFTYTLTDADGDVSTATALLTVNPIDDLPVAVDDTFLTDEDSALTQTLAPNDTPSGDGGNTWALATGPSHGTVVVNADGSFTYTPDADYHGPDSFTYTLTDADGDVSTATALLTVNPIDDLPVAVDDTFLTDEDSALTGQTLAPNDTPSGDGGNTWALATGPSHGTVVVNADGSFTYTPDADYHGPDSFTYTLTDADGDVSTATALLTVNPIDDLPVAVDDTFLTDEDSALTQTLAPNDTPSGDGGNTWALATGPSHGTVVVNADGSFTYTPDADYHGPDSFTYTLTDADGDVSTATALLTVNPIDDLPVAVDDTFLTDEDSALTQTLAPNDTPSGDGGNTWALATGPSHGSVVVNADGSFTYTPDADYHGPDSFTYTLTDADGDVSTATALLTVNPIDDLPVAVDDTFLTDEDSALTQTLAPNDTPSGDGGNTWALATGPSHGSVVVNADGSFTYTPDADYHGPDSFTYTLTDADGDVSTATALLTVNPIDDLPVAVDDTFLTDEDSALTGQTLAPNDTPSGDGGNTWALATGPSHGSVVVNADGSFTYTPDADYHGPDSFTYTLTDADGDVSTATALLTVNPIDDLPVAVDDTFLTDEDSALTQTLAPNDTPSGDGGNTWALATGPSHGTVVVNADGSFTYTPDADYHGPDSFTYTLTDADGDVSTATALLTVNPIDDLPVAVDDTFLTDEDSALTGQTLAPNDTPSGDGGNTWALATGPSHGTVVVNADGSFTYTPDADYHGPDSFTYTLTDADGDVSTATALLTVNPIDDLPVAVDDTFLTDEDSALTGQTLAPNDTPSGDGGNTWALATGPSHGTVVVNADGSFTYTPDADYHGPDSFTYTLTDADGDVSTATALLTVNPIDDLPVAVDDTFLTDEDSALTGQTLAPNDTPSGDGGNTWALATGPSHGSVVVNADGSFTYTPDADYHGPDSFTYTLTDADGDVSTATITITVTAAELTGLPPDFNQPESLLAGIRLGPLAFQPGTRVNDSMRQPIPFQPAAFVTSAVEASQLERAFNDPEGNGTDIAAVSPYETRLTSETRELGFVPAVFVQSSVRQSQADAHFLDLRVSGRQGVVKLSSDERLPSFSLFQAPPLGQTIEEIREEREEREQRDRRSSGDERIAAIREQAAPAIALTVASPVAAGVIGRTVATRAFSEQLRDASARLRPLADIRSLQHLHKSST
jgi:hypothetical protein